MRQIALNVFEGCVFDYGIIARSTVPAPLSHRARGALPS